MIWVLGVVRSHFYCDTLFISTSWNYYLKNSFGGGTAIPSLLAQRPNNTHRTTMSWGCGVGNTRSTTLAAEKEAAAAGTQLDNATLINILMGRMTVDVNPLPTAADATWPDEEHVVLARHAIENPFLVVPHPKNTDHHLCVKCGIFARYTLVVPAPGSLLEWLVCKGMFLTTHCRLCAAADVENEYVYDPVSCGCGVSRPTRGLACSECYKAENESRNCSMEGCGEKKHGNKAYCKSCCNLNEKCPMTCFLCGEEIIRDVINAKGIQTKKAGIRECIGKDNMGCFRRCNAYEGGVRGGEGGNDGQCQRDRFMNKKIQRYNSKTCGQLRCKTDCTLLSEY